MMMLKSISINQIPVIDVIIEKVEHLAPGVEIEDTAHENVDTDAKILSLRWENNRASLPLSRALLDDLRDAPSQMGENWENLMQKLEVQIEETIQQLGYHSGEIGFRR